MLFSGPLAQRMAKYCLNGTSLIAVLSVLEPASGWGETYSDCAGAGWAGLGNFRCEVTASPELQVFQEVMQSWYVPA